ncbi:MAG: trypsin-like peptidase domain-containing protein [Alphaproteobacteria bacterium]
MTSSNHRACTERRGRAVATFAIAAALVFAAAAVGRGPAEAASPGLRRDGVPSLAPLVNRITPAVVNIATRGHVRGSPMGEGGDRGPSSGGTTRQVTGIGSGVIVDARNGYVLTNHHVVRRADQILVRLKDRRVVRARVIGSDAGTDIAVLQIRASGLKALPLGNSDNLQVGDYVVAVGNPFGLGQTVTMGIVSALGRSGLSPRGYESYIQTDASINPGNSGGPLLDLHGRVVGINAAIIGRRTGGTGIGFAIPANMARRVMNQILRYGNVRRGRLGVVIQDLTPSVAKRIGVPIGPGAVVREVQPNTAAARAGIRQWDLIVAVDGATVRDAGGLRSRIGTLRVGDRVRLRVVRATVPRTISVVIGPAAR